MRGKSLSCVRLSVTLWTVAHQAPLSIGFSRQEHWRALPFPSPGDLPDPGIEPVSLTSPALAGYNPVILLIITVRDSLDVNTKTSIRIYHISIACKQLKTA